MQSLRFSSFAYLFQHVASLARGFVRSMNSAQHAPQQSLLIRLD